jgi:DNA-binding LacI/PurR family transcriptional regulator
VQVFRIACNPVAGIRIGNLLAKLGHRNIAYLSVGDAPNDASASRLNGLRQAFAHIGGSTIHCEELAQPGGRGGDSALAEAEVQRAFERVLRRLDRNDPALVKQTIDQVRNLSVRNELLRVHRPRFRRLLDTGSITAWVCYSDDLALGALQFLRDAGEPVPGRMSVVGFDNDIHAHIARLTTYDFDGAAAMEAMLSFVLGMPLSGRGPGGVYELDGFIVERQTTAAPR